MRYEDLMEGALFMTNENNQKSYKWLLKIALVVYIVELIWFFYSKIIRPMINGEALDVTSVELAIILGISLIVLVVFLVLKKSRKIGGILIGILVVSIIAFGVIAPLLDVYIPVIWQIFHQIG